MNSTLTRPLAPRNDHATTENRLDIATIRRRVAAIKESWSAQERQRRAAQGKLRRQQLEWLLCDQKQVG